MIGRIALVLGVIVQAVGLGTIALGIKETSPLTIAGSTLSRGQLLFVGGLAVTLLAVLGLLIAALVRRPLPAFEETTRTSRRSLSRLGTVGAALLVVCLTAGTVVYATRTSASVAARASTRAPAFANPQLEAIEGGFVQAHNHSEVALTYAQLQQLDTMLGEAKAASRRYLDVNNALADGYVQISQDIPELGAHFINFNLADQPFDITQPPILLYEKVHNKWNLVGVSYLMPKDGPNQPTVFPGPLAVWHAHQNLCISPRTLFISIATKSQCEAKLGQWIKDTGWMIHLWLWKDSPTGVFSHVNPAVG